MINGELIVDNFAGGGGASTGIEMATGISVDIAINHDPEAIRMHKTNHPSTKHYCESVWDVDPVKVCNGHSVGIAWFSPDCKHFSKAKGGKPKDKNIRGLAWVALRWAGKVRPRVIMLENVEEFKTWGPLNRRHRPIKAKQGITYRKFISQLEELGYTVESRELVAADYGAPTMRKRFFLIARCDGRPIIWPEPTHAPADSPEVAAGLRKPYLGAYTQIDFTLPCPSIFDTAEEIKEKYGIRAVRPLAHKTMERIARGLIKFLLDNANPFIIPIGYGERDGQKPRVHDIKEPLPTIVSSGKHYLCEPYMVQIGQTGFTADRSKDVREPLTTIVSKNEHCLVEVKTAPCIMCNNENNVGASIESPLPTITTGNRNFVVAPTLIQYHSETSKDEVRGQAIEKPIMTVDGSNRYGLVTSFLSKFYKTGVGQDIREPLGTVTANAGGGHFGEVRVFLEEHGLYETDRCNKRANRTGNNLSAERRKVLEDIQQGQPQKEYHSDRPQKDGSTSEIRLSRCCDMEGWKTILNVGASCSMGDILRGDSGGDGYQPQKWEQAGQQIGESGSRYPESESATCNKNRSENIQQLSREILGTGEIIEEKGNVVFENREGTANIADSSLQGGEFQSCTLIKYYGQGVGQDVKEPLDTVTSRDRFGLVTISGVDYQIVDIGLRMLEPKELYGCQGFPDDYIISHDYTGKSYPRSEQVKRCGNAVCPPIPAALVRANLPELCIAERTGNMRIGEEQNGQMKFA